MSNLNWEQQTIYEHITLERRRQHKLWDRNHDWGYGDCSHPNTPLTVKLAVLGEEYGEACRAVLERDPIQLRTELIQTAAVAVAIVEWLDAGGHGTVVD